MNSIRVALIALLVTTTLLAQDPPEPGSKAKSEVKKYVQRLSKAKSDEDRQEALIGLCRHGRKGIEFIESSPLKPDEVEALNAAREDIDKLLGRDILKANKSVTMLPWSISYLKFGEIALIKKDETFAGFMLHDGPEVAMGKLKLTWWSQEGPAKKLDQAGGDEGELILEGKKADKPIRPNAGYDEFNFEFELGGAKHRLRYIGPAYFLFDPAPGFGFCFSGESKPAKLRNSDDGIVYIDSQSDQIPRLTRQLQDYIYRIVPGAEPLNLAEEEKEQFAQYEAVQIFIRKQRRSSAVLVLIKFLEPGQIQFEDHHPDYMINFIREIIPIEEDSILISVGSAPSLEGNQYWEKGKWTKPKGKLVDKLRANFPEDY